MYYIMKTLLALFILAGLYSCDNLTQGYSKGENQKNKILLINIVQHPFSDAAHPDMFKLTLTGDSIINGKALFQILNYKNKVLFTDSFAAKGLLHDGSGAAPGATQREDTIVKEIRKMFADAHFGNAVRLVEKSDSGFSHKDLNPAKNEQWNDIISDTSAIGFMYAYRYKGICAIAYSKKKQKVVTYFTTD